VRRRHLSKSGDAVGTFDAQASRPTQGTRGRTRPWSGFAGGPLPVETGAVAGVLAPGVLAGIGLAFASPRQLPRVLPTEDGFYALAVARHIALGQGMSADGVMPTNGFQPLWSFLCAPLYALAGGDRILGLRLVELLGTLMWFAFAGLLAAYSRDVARRHGLRGRLAAMTAIVVALGSVSVYRLFHNGLETGVLLVLLCAAVLVLDRLGRWTPGRTVAVGILLGAVAWARVDGALFIAAVGALALADRLWHRRGAVVPRLAACGIGAVLLVPWLAYGVSLDGHLVPSGGRAQSLGRVDLAHNASATARAIGGWILAPAFRPTMHRGHGLDLAIGVAAMVLLVAAVAVVAARAARPSAGLGTAALWLYVAGLVAYYTLAQGSWWFQDRYLAAALLLAVPWLAAALEALLPPRAVLGAAAVVAVLNLPLFGVLVAAPRRPPAWAAAAANTGTHPNLNWDQTRWALQHVRPGCRVGARETGTLLYFRPNTVNLDGTVSSPALAAQTGPPGALADYVDRARVDVLIDALGAIRLDTGQRWGRTWRSARRIDARFLTTVRRGRERCVR
jgi:hypothetical protein